MIVFSSFPKMDLNSTENQATRCQISDAQLKFYQIYSWWIKGIASICLSTLGIILNTVAIYILCHKRMRKSLFHNLLLCLTITDLLFLSNGVYVALIMQLIEPFSEINKYIFVSALYPARNVIMCISIYMTVGLSYERYTSIVRPYLQLTRQKTKNFPQLLLYIGPIFACSVLFNLPKYFELKIENTATLCPEITPDETIKISCTRLSNIFPTELRNNRFYVLWYVNVSNLIVTSIIPGVLLTFFNYKIYSACKVRQQKRATMLTQSIQYDSDAKSGDNVKQRFVLFAIVAMFFMCHLLRVVLNIAETVDSEIKEEQWKKGCPGIGFWGMIVLPISGFMLQVNSSANFFIYCIYDHLFNDILCSYIPTKRRQNMLGVNVMVNENIKMEEIH